MKGIKKYRELSDESPEKQKLIMIDTKRNSKWYCLWHEKYWIVINIYKYHNLD